MSAFTGYFDASGTEHDQPCLAVAGYVTSTSQWAEFEGRRLERLRRDGVECFHANEINRVVPNKASRDVLYGDLIEIIAGSGVRQFGCCILKSSLGAVSDVERKEWNLTSYGLAGRACAGQVRQWFKSWNANSLPEFIFERGDVGSGALTEVLEKDGFPVPTFKPKRDTFKNGVWEKAAIPLQAADLLAFECFDPVLKIEKDGYLLRIRPSWEALYRIPGEVRAIHLKTMKHLVKFGTMNDEELWVPNGPDDIPMSGL